ncbi:SDR family NAD(P)-dependent oxidoreductase [Leptospira sp. 2 VSF19]|uniref:SDR family NAD(P)-dependent oxidoreductase n=1 Tax=Leptospira soteropolitanensis TaxID=2950025 RepID=A0AAW5VPM2_9LEPT|nr:SDR family NAD(P)-dependent oxidoreductase [Leptospira soteropolitanensis]MCW7493812.1 SDR family NAD(P)-dependent oxidoreductase [Leptospira soteropolitanensis]MCW7501407.1 SDR family NAD(P)-dependent oxidoreductase [Leptospira soteropolitanensis]MCW7523830.1 SDR family NAD(P)-dependent oxidoreductase [Leptospira soteropolitanensis]MCW7527695.1 SDR family NAD(P)-dependent oxidoreductase [Leptospira soteropolitanensis]MCW7531548.1 SDR family NAD(P)-dependent oxidoreductase [Leptospira soter
MKNALVVGATSDIGTHIGESLAKRGFSLSLTGRNKQQLAELKSKFQIKYPIAVETFEWDVTDFSLHQKFYQELPTKPDIVFFVVGYYEDQTKAREDQIELLKTIQVNYSAVVSLMNIISLDMEKRNEGTIVAISSVAGDRGRQMNYIYGSAKAGLTTYLSGLRSLLFSKGVQITTIQLGPVYTKMSEGHNLIPWLTLQPQVAAELIVKAGLSKKDLVYIRWPWRFIMMVIRMIPEWIFKRLPPF